MALGMVQTGYKNSLYMYPAWYKSESDFDYAELLAELTGSLELAWDSENEEPITEEDREDSEQKEAHLDRKKEWEELLEQSVVLEAMLRQMLENGLGQQKEEQQKPPKKQENGELDNEFDMSGVPVAAEGKSKSGPENSACFGNSCVLQTNVGRGSEYFSPSGGARKQYITLQIMCLTCETECDRKKQWKITE